MTRVSHDTTSPGYLTAQYERRQREIRNAKVKRLGKNKTKNPSCIAPQETLEQLAARLPFVGDHVKALEFGEFRFPNGMSLLAYIGGIETIDGVDCIPYSQTTTVSRGSVYLGHNTFRFGQEDILEFGSGRIQVYNDPSFEELPIEIRRVSARPVYTRIKTVQREIP